MKRLMFILIMLFFSCNGQIKPVDEKKSDSINKERIINSQIINNAEKKKKSIQKDTILIESDSVKVIRVIAPERIREDFEINISNDTILVHSVIYESILGKVLKFIPNEQIKRIKYKMKIEFGFTQYVIDKHFNLNFPIHLTGKNQIINQPYIELPNFTYLDSDYKFAEIFGFKNNRQLVDSIEKKYFHKIRPLSLKKQRKIYQEVLWNKNAYNCCPEYIENAISFIKRKEFYTFKDLGVEIIVQKIQLNIIIIGNDSNIKNIVVVNSY
jgi:hypothetical protein